MTRAPASAVAGAALGVVLALGAGGIAAAQGLVVTAEPGVALPGGGALVPFHVADSSGVAFPVRAGEIAAESEGGGRIAADLVSFSGSGAEPFALDLLLDPAAIRDEDSAAWSAQLASFLGEAPAAGTRSVHLAGARLTPLTAGDVASADALRSRLQGAGDGPIWDRVLDAVDRLSATGPPARRVLVLVTNGEEARESRHPVATCADAADTARVAVWVVTPRSPAPAARARLASLAARAGGAVVPSSGSSAAALAAALGRVRGTQALRLASLPQAPPVAVLLRPGVASAAPVRAWIRERRALGLAKPPFPWIPLAATVAFAAVVFGIVLIRHRPVGRLRGVAGISGVFPVTRSGLTIGGAVGNALVLADSRVSRHHAVIRSERGRMMLVDLRSSNGTKVNGRAVTSAALRDRDRIVFADAVELVWEQGGFRFGGSR